MCGRCSGDWEPNWQLVLLVAPVALELLRQALGMRFGQQRLFYLDSPSPWMTALVVLATVLAVATPIKIWNSARIEHRLQEQEKLLLAAKIEALKSQINPHFLFNTLASISRDSIPAGYGAHAHHQIVRATPAADAQPSAFRHPARRARID